MTGTENKNEKKGARGWAHDILDRVIDGTSTAVRKADEGLDYLAKKGLEMHEDIMRKGGYQEAAVRIGESIAQRIDSISDELDEGFFTNGEFDREKARKTLSNKAETVKRYGQNTFDHFSKLAQEGAETARAKYRDLVPTSEEMGTKYAGIGVDRKIMLRPELDACLAYHGEADSKMKKGAGYRAEILRDIKASGSTSVSELLQFYSARIFQASEVGSVDDYTMKKMTAASKMLKE